MATIRNIEVLKATPSKHAETTTSNADKVSSGDDDRSSSSSSEDLNFRGFSKEEKEALYADRATYRNFTTCDVPKFTGDLNPIASTRWITAVEGAFRTSECEDKNKVNFASNFLRDSAKIWWEGKMCEKEKFQRMLKDEIREVISPFKCTTLEDLLGRARIREADLTRKKNNKKKELKRKQEYEDVGAKRARFDHGKKSSGKQVKSPYNKCHKLHYGECRPNMKRCYKCGDLNHMSRDCRKPMIVCYGCNEIGCRLSECPKAKVIEAKPLRAIKEEKAKAPKAKARVYPMTAE
ncbi:putative reverse transcriptase domain-containing protein [Tanacetum coccineum]|uniref:Reverse transcriptase domain-containing protein n=1 Tax=Tanacetum coccineum TaxID=301880 RepID=A0ABQ5GL28_9ASTR